MAPLRPSFTQITPIVKLFCMFESVLHCKVWFFVPQMQELTTAIAEGEITNFL